MLNMSVQMRHQLDTYGTYSQEIEDYTRLGLQDQMDTETGQRVRSIVDPFSYRERLVLPKLIMLGTNDAYWTLDALNNYWSELQGPKYILYVPNNGHGLKDLGRVTGSLIALHDHVTKGTPLPELRWDFSKQSDTKRMRLTIHSDMAPKTVQAWIASSATKDFRQSEWTSVTCEESDGDFRHDLEIPARGYVAMFGEAVYNGRDVPYYLSTNVRILSASE
jgi:PhoPQ-activated pathogenicity-related protein